MTTLGSVLAAMLLSAATLAPRHERTLLVGRPGDAQSLEGFSLPSDYLGERGRWSRGEGVLRLPPSAAPSTLLLMLAPPADRVPDQIDIEIDGVRSHHAMLAGGFNEKTIATEPRVRATETTVRIRSAATGPATGSPQGVFVSRITVRTGGLETLPRTPRRTWAAFALIWLAVLVTARLITQKSAQGIGRWLATTAVVALTGFALVVFRTEVFAHLFSVAALCWTAAVATAVSQSPAATRALDRTSPRRAALLFILCAAGLLALLFPETLTRGHVLSEADIFYAYFPWRSHLPAGYHAIERPPLNDVPMLAYPFAAFTQARWWEGVFPLWTSGIGSGQPFLATYQSALFSPFTLILAIVPLPLATVAIAALRLLVGGFGMFVFLKAIGLSRWSSAFGGITYLLNPFTLVWLEHPLAGVPPWLPWMLLSGELVATRHRWGLGALAASTALVLSGGHPHTGMFVAVLAGAYALGRAALSPQRTRALVRACAALAIGTAIVAVQVLPFLEYLSLSRAATVRNAEVLNRYVAPVSTLITAVVPNFLGHHGWGNFAGPSNYFEQQAYPGITTWLFAGIALACGLRQWRTWFFAAASLTAMLVMYGAPGMHQLVSALPLVRAASLPRVAIVTTASLAILAAFGVDEVLRSGRSPRSAWRLTVALALAAGTLGLLAVGALRDRAAFLEATGLVAFATRWTTLGLWIAALALVLATASLHQVTRRSAVACALVGLAALDLLLFGRGFHPMISPDQVFPLVPEIEAVRRDPGLFRVMGLGDAMMPNAALVYGLQDVRSYDGLTVARYADLLDVALRAQPFMHVAGGIHSPLVNLLNVKYVFSDGKTPIPDAWFTKVTGGEAPVYRNERVLPRAFLVDGYVVRDGNAARRALRDGLVDFRRVALLEGDPPIEERPVPAAADRELGSARVAHYRDQVVEVRTAAPARRLLVLTDVHYPGWRATVDGRPVPLYRANFAFRAVSVPDGQHTVRFEYRPRSAGIGIAVSATALVFLAITIVYDRRHTIGSGPAW